MARFTGGEPIPPNVPKDLANIAAIGTERLPAFLQALYDYVETEDANALKSNLQQLASEFSVPFQVLRNAARGLVTVIQGIAALGLTYRDLGEDLVTMEVEPAAAKMIALHPVAKSRFPVARAAQSPAKPPSEQQQQQEQQQPEVPAAAEPSTSEEKASEQPPTTAASSESASAATSSKPVTTKPRPAADRGLSSIPISMVPSMTVNKLVDMSWRFGLTTANSDTKNLGETFLQMKLTLDVGNATTNTVHVELTLPQFYELLAELEKAKTSVDLFS